MEKKHRIITKYKRPKPLTAKQWLNELEGIRQFLKKGISVSIASKMLENYAAYRVNHEKSKNDPQPPMIVIRKSK